MSGAVTDLVWDSDVRDGRLTLLALARFADDDGLAWPSMRALAARAQLGESTVRRHLDGLEAGGLVSIRQRFNASCLYRIDVAALRARAIREPLNTRSKAPDPSQIGSPSQSDTGYRDDTPPDLIPGVDPSTPPVIPSSNPSQIEHLSLIEATDEATRLASLGDARADAHEPPPEPVREGPTAIARGRRNNRRRANSAAELAKTARSVEAYRLVEAWAGTCKLRPGPQLLTTLGVQVDELLTRGWPADVLAGCISAWAAKGLGPSAFQSVANEVVNAPAAAARASPPRLATTDQRVADAQALKERFRSATTHQPQVIDLRALPGGNR